MKKSLQFFIGVFLLFGVSGCTSRSFMMTSLLTPTVSNLQRQTDIHLVCEGTPSFLLMIDSLLDSDAGSDEMLIAAVKSYVAYSAALDVCGRPERSVEVSQKARRYGMQLLSRLGVFPSASGGSPSFASFLFGIGSDDVALLFWGGYGWATWIHSQEGSPASLADLVRVEQIMLRVIDIDETFYHGAAHIFLGAYYGSRPPLLGGKPEASRSHFEKALAVSDRRFLPAFVAYAETYAKMTFDRQLFAELLQETLDFPLADNPDQSLANQLAKRNARKLLDTIDTYF
ncbi:MAG: hypothetical protein H8E41_12695 [Desulfobulbaceae bacterium]|uniref:TRAP transporter T-component n=1 Tax=Candidatus Desulfobia pelagia TaxID=2841692 RepID=A0A8J6TDH5_9BACT|nr:hypothetical protein [Candidatus Desulfobia pelagia]